MEGDSLSQRKAQLDKAEREHLEDVVEDLRERVENNVRFQLTQKGLDDEPEDVEELDEEIQHLVEAIDIEGVDGHTWDEAFKKYITGVGYTIVNRLAALRCMEVRDFIDEEVTVFKENGLTPAAETLVHEEFLLEDEAILEAYHNACDELAEEIEILFDRSSAYSLIDPDDDTFEELCGMLDEVPDEVWRADDILGWIYEYYNRPVVEALDAKNTLESDDVGPANQFYTPHWVVRMLTDNSLGKLYLEATDQTDTIPEPKALSPEERKDRLVTPADAPSVPELCTYLIPDEEPGDAPEFDHPRELRVIDPACGSGHFLLYAFDILERIWWAETNLDRAEIPAKVLEHNLYGVDIDLRSCQLSAFNLYLKARTRANEEGGDFEMPNIGIVCADARVAEVEEAADVLNEITGEGTGIREALDNLIHEFQHTEALGSLLDVQATLEDEFETGQSDILEWGGTGPMTLNAFLRELENAVEKRTSDSFSEQNLRSFLNLLVVLTQDYDVALMNPPYGSGGRMPNDVQDYVENHYEYKTEYYINFFEACDRLARTDGRVGMLVPRTFMFKRSFGNFRNDFIRGDGAFDFLAEYGIGILDNATVRTVGTVVRSGTSNEGNGTFIRLEDIKSREKERVYLHEVIGEGDDEIQRTYNVAPSDFTTVPWTPLSYYTPPEVRTLHESDLKLDPEAPKIEGEGVGTVAQGIISGNNPRFVRKHWEVSEDLPFSPLAKGGSDAWIEPRVTNTILFDDFGEEIKRAGNSRFQNTRFYFKEGVTWTNIKETGRRFGHHSKLGIFDQKSPTLFPDEHSPWELIAILNSSLYHSLMLSMTPDREWNPGDVGRLPWESKLNCDDVITDAVQEQASIKRHDRSFDITSPYYTGPGLLPERSESGFFHSHPYTKDSERIPDYEEDDFAANLEIQKMARQVKQKALKRSRRLEELAEIIDKRIYDVLGISARAQEQIHQEIFLRTSESPEDREIPEPESVSETPEALEEQVKELVHYFVLKAVREENDGIIPISAIDSEDDLLTHIEAKFEHVWGEHANARLAEVDEVLGSKSAAEEAYPNLRTWLEEDLFDYHVSKFDRTPILWRFTTERLVSDPEGKGFGCLMGYHQLDEGVFDRLKNRYLEPRKNLLRERRSAANRRRSDDSLSATEQAEAAQEYARCESGLEQIAVFEDRFAELAQPDPREWPTAKQQIADEAAERVAEFRRRTEERLEIVDELAAIEDVDLGELFTGNFYEKVENQREEWIDALDDLETAFDAYAADSNQPVEAHMYDLFDYYTDDLLGSSHFASNGILYMTYYFDDFEQADQARLDDAGISRRQRLISQLANDLDEYIELGESISENCEDISSEISSDWSDRALSEITTAGYQPNHKHGVEINITPLSDAEIVPKIVEDEVL